ncbi:MAG: hypothetical protein DMG05_20765, partial [Acidobacteria bacterium]
MHDLDSIVWARSNVKSPEKRNEAVLETRAAFTWRKYGGFVLAAVAFGVMLVSTSTLSRPTPQVKVLDDFETDASLTRWQGSVKISTAHPAHGRNCLEVRFDSHSGILTTAFQEGNWTGYERLLFDVYNPEATPIILSLRLYDAVGGDGPNVAPHDLYRADRKLFLGSGWTHIEVVLRDLDTSSELRSIALDQVRRLTIMADTGSHPLTLFFDNLRLVTGAEGDSTLSAQAPQDITTRLEGRWVTILQVGPRDKIPESATVRGLRNEAQLEYQALKSTIESSEHMGLDTIYSQAELVVAELGLYFRPTLAWFNNDREKERMFGYAAEACRRERQRLEKLLTGEVRLPERDDTQVSPPPVPPYPRLRNLSIQNGFFVNQDERPLFITSVHGPSRGLLKFFATPMQHIESYSVGGGSRWTVRS